MLQPNRDMFTQPLEVHETKPESADPEDIEETEFEESGGGTSLY